jgi:predicted permease
VINLKLAFRTLFRTPFVTTVAIASLALGIGANAAIFSMFDRILLQPLPVPDAARLVNLGAPGPKQGSSSSNQAGDGEQIFSYPMFRDLERAQTVFSGIAAHRLFGVNLAFEGQTVNGDGLLVSGSYFQVLGLQPALGRLIGPADDAAGGGSPVVVLSHTYWETRFGSSPAVLGKTMIVNGQALTIIGVAPDGFSGTTFAARPNVFVPITMRPLLQPLFKGMEDRKSYWAYLFARLKPGVSVEQARSAINVPYHAILNDVEAPLQKMSDQTMARFRGRQVTVETGARGQSNVDREARAPMNLLLGVTGIVLLIACANIANLLLARGAARTGEISVRLSLGASRWQLVAQLLTESCLLAALGGLGGLFVARWTLDSIVSLLPGEVDPLLFALDRTALLYTAVITLGTGLLFGLFPALYNTKPDLISALKGQAGQPSGAKAAKRFRATLATVQIALSLALLISAGLFTRSLLNVSRVDLGVAIDNVVTFHVSPELNGYRPEASRQFLERLEDELAALPGVTGVTDSVVPLLANANSTNNMRVQGYEAGPDTNTIARYNAVGPGYFQTLGIPMIAGRDFTRADALGSQKVAIVNEAFARKFNLGRDAVGKRTGTGSGSELDIEIVGLVENATYNRVKDENPPVFFRPYRQTDQVGSIYYYIRTSQEPEQLLAAVAKVVAGLDGNLPVQDLRTMPNQVRQNMFLDRFLSILSAAFASLATLLAAIGLYGVLAYTVAQRTREIGLRMALGASPARVRRMILRQVGGMTAIGITIGLLAAFGLGRLAQSMLYQLQGSDPMVLTASVAVLALVALGAGFIPAHRASRVDPMRALRYE